MKCKTLQIDMWQFVRIMVEAEKNTSGAILLNTYADIWQDVDTTLSKIAHTDMEKYAALMMETSVTLTEVHRQLADCIIQIAGEVIRQLSDALNSTDNQQAQQDYAFEIQGLEQLVDEIRE